MMIFCGCFVLISNKSYFSNENITKTEFHQFKTFTTVLECFKNYIYLFYYHMITFPLLTAQLDT